MIVEPGQPRPLGRQPERGECPEFARKHEIGIAIVRGIGGLEDAKDVRLVEHVVEDGYPFRGNRRPLADVPAQIGDRGRADISDQFFALSPGACIDVAQRGIVCPLG